MFPEAALFPCPHMFYLIVANCRHGWENDYLFQPLERKVTGKEGVGVDLDQSSSSGGMEEIGLLTDLCVQGLSTA